MFDNFVKIRQDKRLEGKMGYYFAEDISPEESVKEWYGRNFPTDDLGMNYTISILMKSIEECRTVKNSTISSVLPTQL